MRRLTFAECIARLRQRLAGPLPGIAAHLQMAPAYRQSPDQLRVEGKPCREAGVLALLFPEQDDPYLLLVARPAHLKDHGGQIGFPGGRREQGETLQETALREAYEELGLPPERIDVLGALTPLYIPVSNYCVHPFVGCIASLPELRPCPEEVEAVLRIPLTALLDPTNRRRERWMIRGQAVMVPFFAIQHYRIWGATAMMLAELLALLREETLMD
ncbi:NUDIX hydrolase [Rhodothermus profundi]|uniref:NUDIX domain-containing protein n=1 Tax=Rhodothermus profundi TaxID=633813 RepID=A0A1M6Q9N8_9BACT|nr:CoA pyrophosphatase [Rhodothermus profundi]SHK16868.1 NUDIX domain-containing protein [Rhodothermus profundi]